MTIGTPTDQVSRLVTGGLIDRRFPLRFRFDDQELTGYAGDTLASALVANGVRLVGRSFKYHRPRGILTAGSEEPNALVELAHRRAARAQHARDDGRALRRARRATARTAGRRSRLRPARGEPARLARSSARASTTRPSCGRPAFWEKLYEPADPPRRRPRPRRGRARPRPLREGPRLLRRAGDRRRAGRAAAALAAGRAGARVILCRRGFPPRRAAARRAARGRRQAGRGVGGGGRGRARGDAERPHHAADHRVRRL